MSTILKALRRLEREKSARSDRPLGEVVAEAAPPPSRRRPVRWLMAGGVLTGALAVAAVVFLILPLREGENAGDPVEVAATSQKPSPARPTAKRRRSTARAPGPSNAARERLARGPRAEERRPRRAEPAAPPGLPPAALSSEVEVVERVRPVNRSPEPGAPAPSAAEEPARSEPGTVEPALTSGSVERTAAPSKPGLRHPETPEAEESFSLAAAAPAGKPSAIPRPEPEPSPAPRAAEPPLVLRSGVPDVYVERTIWHPLAERRVAVVELEGGGEALELHEGDAVGPLVVEEIEPSGVFFIHDGVELRRRVGAR